jgi:hypothetical protein
MHEKDNLKGKILQIFEEEENVEVYMQDDDGTVRFVGRNRDSRQESQDGQEDGRRRQKLDRRERSGGNRSRSSSDDERNDKTKKHSRNPRRKDGLHINYDHDGNMRGPEGQNYPNTAEVRGYHVMRGELDGDPHDRLRGGHADSDLTSRASLDFYDDEPGGNKLQSSYPDFHRYSKRPGKDSSPQGQTNYFNSSQDSPQHSNKASINSQDLRLPLRAPSQQETFRSPRSKRSGDIPEAWLVFPGAESRAHHAGGFGTDRAVPVNLANSIGSRLQVPPHTLKT